MAFAFIHKPKVQIIIRFIVDFLKHNPIHCTSYLAKTQIHWCELIFWILALLIFLTVGGICGMNLIAEYISRNSALTSNIANGVMQTFHPSLTLCPHDILDRKKVMAFKREYTKRLFKEMPSPLNLNKLLKEVWKMEEFLQSLSKTTAKKAYPYNTSFNIIPPEEYMQLIFNLSRNYNVRVENKTAVKIMTEIGICYTISNFLSKELYTKYWQDLNPYPKNYADRFIYKQLIFNFASKFPLRTNINHNITGNVTVYAHSPYEIPTVWTRPVLIIPKSDQVFVLKASVQEITYNKRFFKKKIKNFVKKPKLDLFPFALSTNICVMRCRAEYITQLCNCVPHFYAHKYWNDINVCNIEGLKCFQRYIQIFRKINTNTISPIFRCNCSQQNPIEHIVVVKRVNYNKRKWNNDTKNLIFQIEHPPIQSYTKIIMYNNFDYFVSLSGALSSFFGFTIYGLCDFLYFFTIRIYWFRRGFRGAVDELIDF